MSFYYLVLCLIFLLSTSITWYFSDEIQEFLDKELNFLQFYIISGVIGYLIVVLIAITISWKFNRPDVATDILTLDFVDNLKETLFIELIISPLAKSLRKL